MQEVTQTASKKTLQKVHQVEALELDYEHLSGQMLFNDSPIGHLAEDPTSRAKWSSPLLFHRKSNDQGDLQLCLSKLDLSAASGEPRQFNLGLIPTSSGGG